MKTLSSILVVSTCLFVLAVAAPMKELDEVQKFNASIEENLNIVAATYDIIHWDKAHGTLENTLPEITKRLDKSKKVALEMIETARTKLEYYTSWNKFTEKFQWARLKSQAYALYLANKNARVIFEDFKFDLFFENYDTNELHTSLDILTFHNQNLLNITVWSQTLVEIEKQIAPGGNVERAVMRLEKLQAQMAKLTHKLDILLETHSEKAVEDMKNFPTRDYFHLAFLASWTASNVELLQQLIVNLQ